MPEGYVFGPQIGCARAESGLSHVKTDAIPLHHRNRHSRIADNRAVAVELTDETTPYDPAAYIDLILRCATNLFLPFRLDLNSLMERT
jgi:hypothetical protein